MNGHVNNENEMKFKMLIEGLDDDDEHFSQLVRIFKP